MPKQLEKVYDPKQVEDKTYRFWEEGRYFHAEPQSREEALHHRHPAAEHHRAAAYGTRPRRDAAGHPDPLAADAGLRGALAARHRPRVDRHRGEDRRGHAARRASPRRTSAARDFWSAPGTWKEQYGGRIIEQLKKLGSSCDWERERFTLDEGCSKAVREVFVSLYEKGLIYRGERIINWCPHCKTSISDAEVEYEEKDGHLLAHAAIPIDGTDELSRARHHPPGDACSAIPPWRCTRTTSATRHLVGKTVILPLVGKEIPIIADEYVEMDFGTGVVKITPAHDPNDFEVGPAPQPAGHQRDERGRHHQRKRRQIRGHGPARSAARRSSRDLEARRLPRQGRGPYKHNVGACYRCGTHGRAARLQAVVRQDGAARQARHRGGAQTARSRFVPERFDKIYYQLDGEHQGLVHFPPALVGPPDSRLVLRRLRRDDRRPKRTPHACPKCGGTHLHQDEDTLDTWFSSALWPFSTLGWPDKTAGARIFLSRPTPSSPATTSSSSGWRG